MRTLYEPPVLTRYGSVLAATGSLKCSPGADDTHDTAAYAYPMLYELADGSGIWVEVLMNPITNKPCTSYVQG